MLSNLISKAEKLLPLIPNEDAQICWSLLLRCPEELAFLDDWIDYLHDERGCCGFDTLNMDVVYNENRDKVMVSFLREHHVCDRFVLLAFLKELRSNFSVQVEMRG